MNVSIIITTRDRAAFLAETLAALSEVAVPDGLETELLIVDNGSSDDTATVVSRSRWNNVSIRYVREEQPGKCHALNRGLAETSGEMILFTDDDVRPQHGWIAGMCETLLEHGPCAVAGGVELAPHLKRSWMTPMHRSWLACSDWLDQDRPRGMVGANMGFSREVLRYVPAFDPELGPGALGFGDEQLFASQLLEAGFRIIGRENVKVEHHFEPQRLLRRSWLDAARKRGRAQAYRGHHWEHWTSRFIWPRRLIASARLVSWRRRHSASAPAEGCRVEELTLEYQCALLRAHLQEQHRPRNYDFRGLIKHRHGGPTLTSLESVPVAPR